MERKNLPTRRNNKNMRRRKKITKGEIKVDTNCAIKTKRKD